MSADHVNAIRANLETELERRDSLILDAIEAGHSGRAVAMAAKVDPARVCRVVGKVLAERSIAMLLPLPRQPVDAA